MVSDAKEKSQFLRLPFALTLSLSLSLSLPLPPYLSLSHSLTAPWAGWHSGSLSPPLCAQRPLRTRDKRFNVPVGVELGIASPPWRLRLARPVHIISEFVCRCISWVCK